MTKLTAEQAYNKTTELYESYKNVEVMGGDPFIYIEEYAKQCVEELEQAADAKINELSQHIINLTDQTKKTIEAFQRGEQECLQKIKLLETAIDNLSNKLNK